MFEQVTRRLICAIYLAVILSLTPICVIVTFVLWLLGVEKHAENPLPVGSRRKILVCGDTATKAVHVIRMLGKAGHTVIVADWRGWWSVLRWSKYVSKVYSVPHDHKQYVSRVIEIALSEKVDCFIPVIKKDYAMADGEIGEILSKKDIKCLVTDPNQIEKLDEKIEFMRMCKAFDLSVPSFIDGDEDLMRLAKDGLFKERYFFFKPSACSSTYRNSFERIPDNIADLRVFMERFKEETFFAQEFVKGMEWSANLLSKDGNILQLNISHSSPIQVDYDVINNHHKITEWVTTFCRKSNLTGAVCFDFLENEKGDVFCLECNPRFHSSLVTYNYCPEYERCLLYMLEDATSTFPTPLLADSNVFSYWFYQEFFRVLTFKRSIKDFVVILVSGREALWDGLDPVPFLIMNHVQMSVFLLNHIVGGQYWECVNFCLGRVMY